MNIGHRLPEHGDTPSMRVTIYDSDSSHDDVNYRVDHRPSLPRDSRHKLHQRTAVDAD